MSTGPVVSTASYVEMVAPVVAAAESGHDESPQFSFPDDGIDYDLLSKARSLCTPQELDKICRERNQMHAKRTRDRKRIFIEEMEEMIKQLETENKLLQTHIYSMTAPPPASSPNPPSNEHINADITKQSNAPPE
eukprot:CAMPEP_0172489806 /NCGR_PEP_ID=MMETSP1066-20121228/20033_1 /TAXON_ID=671091 /ORGANISM="Coscinodiscus wailesii, Strain CCMP2513" /LENGTH=134 /DNA_ID=CAMNT_0013257925 /DNA_START=590 /DNA_END=994 /DNA_ORIENTATION=+